ncbi:MAG TPA: TIGR00645 family protein [Azospirillaceae bacterium]|nr:TIGR00645 family protein [Azospirillaceae bacterium]
MERFLELLMFRSRWLLAPVYVGLVVSLFLVVVKFIQELIHEVPGVLAASETDIILMVLSLVDLAMIGNLILMVIFSGYENFVSKIRVEGHEDRPEWMGKLDFGGLKLKLVASIVAISSIHILKAFMHIHEMSDRDLGWMVGIHIAFIVSGVLLALMDVLTEKSHKH